MDPGSIIEYMFWFVKRGKKKPKRSMGTRKRAQASTKKRKAEYVA